MGGVGNRWGLRSRPPARKPNRLAPACVQSAPAHIETNVKQVEPSSRLQHPLPTPPRPGCGVGAQRAGCQLGGAGPQAADDLQGKRAPEGEAELS